ncbi:MAG: hypothetical protein NT027_14965 [Proteobacteria bacterium]|nr:hypothetical protein [Pseudomonadota bacterium]
MVHFKRLILSLSAMFQLTNCATPAKTDDRSNIQIKSEDSSEISITDFVSRTGQANYQPGGKSLPVAKTFLAQWILCSPAAKKSDSTSQPVQTVIAFHRFDAGFSPTEFCKGWIGQVFLKNGFQVIGINRPNYVGSIGPDDLSGRDSLNAIDAAVKQSKVENLVGCWGYDTGTIAASFYAKSNSEKIKWLILGGGIYDLESYLESRSIAWDNHGLPKSIYLYHAIDDTFAPVNQANSFSDQLRTSEFKVFKTDINSGGHDLPWRAHMKIVDQAIKQVSQ